MGTEIRGTGSLGLTCVLRTELGSSEEQTALPAAEPSSQPPSALGAIFIDWSLWQHRGERLPGYGSHGSTAPLRATAFQEASSSAENRPPARMDCPVKTRTSG